MKKTENGMKVQKNYFKKDKTLEFNKRLSSCDIERN